MTIEDLEKFCGGIPFNRTFYGAPCKNGHWVWASDIQDIVTYEDRIRFVPIAEKPFGMVREHLIQHLELNDFINSDE